MKMSSIILKILMPLVLGAAILYWMYRGEVVCCLAAHSPRGRIYALWCADTLRRRVVSQGAGHSGYRACYRLAISDGHHGGRHPAGDEHLRHLLPEDGHQPARHPARFLVDGLPGSSHLRRGHARPAALPAAQALHI